MSKDQCSVGTWVLVPIWGKWRNKPSERGKDEVLMHYPFWEVLGKMYMSCWDGELVHRSSFSFNIILIISKEGSSLFSHFLFLWIFILFSKAALPLLPRPGLPCGFGLSLSQEGTEYRSPPPLFFFFGNTVFSRTLQYLETRDLWPVQMNFWL